MASLASAIRQLVQTEVAAQVAAALPERPAVAELLSTAEAARYARVSSRTLRRWLDDGRLRARGDWRKRLATRLRNDLALGPEFNEEEDAEDSVDGS